MDPVNQDQVSNVAVLGKLILPFDPVLVSFQCHYYSRMCALLSECTCAHIICCVCEGLVLKWKRLKWYPELGHQTAEDG